MKADPNDFTLGIETSCDETSVAVLRGAREVRANVVYSQARLHEKHGGVVPEIASRNHVRKLPLVVHEALHRARIAVEEIGLVAATYGPGLAGPLLVGLSTAKGMAFALQKPFVGVNHLEGHLFAHYIENPHVPPPFVALIVSGGHTLLVHVRAYADYTILGETRDDAAGEAFDKVGKLLGLGYPAGAAIDRLAQRGNPRAVPLPRPMLGPLAVASGYEFSFSGLKTAVVYYLRQNPDTQVEDVAASFQEAVVDVLVQKTLRAAMDLHLDRIVVVGGVAANSGLRQTLSREAHKRCIAAYFPSPELCTDNAAMIAACAHFRHRERGERHGLDLSPEPALRF